LAEFVKVGVSKFLKLRRRCASIKEACKKMTKIARSKIVKITNMFLGTQTMENSMTNLNYVESYVYDKVKSKRFYY